MRAVVLGLRLRVNPKTDLASNPQTQGLVSRGEGCGPQIQGLGFRLEASNVRV